MSGMKQTGHISEGIGNFINQPLGFFPTQTGVRDGFTVNTITDFLRAVFQITFNHESFDQLAHIFAVAHAVQDFFCNANLFQILFAGIGMVGIYNECGILQSFFCIDFCQVLQIFIMVIGQ